MCGNDLHIVKRIVILDKMNQTKKIRVAVLFGGRSSEHEVSLTSALSILKHIDQTKYSVLPIKVSKTGRWQVLPNIKALNSYQSLESSKGTLVLVGDPQSKGLIRLGKNSSDSSAEDWFQEPIDVVFPILHGTFGEDGRMQGLLDLADLPCVGAGVLASALGMDKILMKQIFIQNDLPCPDYLYFLRKDWEKSAEVILKGTVKEIGFPCFVKPANTGSSVGVSKAQNEKELIRAVDQAGLYDRKILVEKAIDARELECAVLGNDDPKASVVGEIVPCNEFYDYDAKYLLDGSKTLVPADLPDSVSQTVRSMSIAAFKALDCAGMGRVDFLLEGKTNRIFINEINTIPGFTPISMYPKLWEASGISYPELIDRLIELALEHHQDLNRSKFSRNP
jgi:D-alanine-D-alanine ligase